MRDSWDLTPLRIKQSSDHGKISKIVLNDLYGAIYDQSTINLGEKTGDNRSLLRNNLEENVIFDLTLKVKFI